MNRLLVSAGVAFAIVVAGASWRSTQVGPIAHSQSVSSSPNQGKAGTNGSAAVNAFGAPNSRSTALATAFQATDPTKPAMVTVNLTSTANISLSGGTTNAATVVMGATSGVASGTGTVICNYSNSNTGALTIGLNLSTIATTTCTFGLPAGWFWATRQTAGTVTVTTNFDAGVG